MPADTMVQLLMAKVFTEASFFNKIKDLLVEPRADWGSSPAPDLTNYSLPMADPGFDRTKKWDSWNPAMDWCLFNGLGLQWPTAQTDQTTLTQDVVRLRQQMAELAEKPPEYRLQIVSSWAEFTTLTESLTSQGGPAC